MKYFFIWLIRLYQKYLSPLKRYPTCRFTPTCSSYAIEAFSEWGIFAGFGLTVWRILRCNPFCAGGYDPVPKRRRKRNKKTEDTDICNGSAPDISKDNSENCIKDSNRKENNRRE